MNITDKEKIKLSKFLSLVLRHSPETINIQLDDNGWTDVSNLIKQLNANGRKITQSILKEIVATSDKKRFAFDAHCRKIRANQGHSVAVNLELEERTPPEILYHGTVEKYLGLIWQKGLQKQSRHHVHLSSNLETAKAVGKRRGAPVILEVLSGEMAAAGMTFFLSENGVWLTDHVPVEFLWPRSEE